MPRAGGSTVRWVSSAGDIHPDLWSGCFPPPVEGRWWYSALERSGLDGQFTFAYAVLEKSGAPVGIAPAFSMDFQFAGIPRPFIGRVLDFLGRYLPLLRSMRILFIGSPCSERGTIGLLPGHRLDDVLPALHEAVQARARQTGAQVIVYKDFAEPSSGAFDPLCGRRLAKLAQLAKMVSYPGTRMRLTGDGFESYLATLKSSRRYKLRKKLDRGRAAVELRAEVVQHPAPALVEEIFALYRQTYEKGKVKFERMTPQFFRAMADEDVCHFVLLSRPGSGRLAAFMMCLRVDSRVVNKFVGLDYGVGGEAFLYFRLYEHAVDWASRAGAREFHSGQGTYASKIELGHGLIPLYNYFEHRSPPLQRIFAGLARKVTWSRLDGDLNAYMTAHPETPGGTPPK